MRKYKFVLQCLPMDTLLLTGKEEQMFSVLSPALQDGWKTEKETLQSFETPKQLQMRFHMSSLKKYPAFTVLKDMLEEGKNVTTETCLDAFSEDLLPEVFFLIGARGLSQLIESVLAVATMDEELKAVAAWSHVRHDILQTNAFVS